MVAESTDIFCPITQFGWAQACSGVTRAKLSSGVSRNGPPEAVSRMRRTPIAFALGYPDRIVAGVDYLDLATIGRLRFSEPDYVRFPCLKLAREALRAGGSAPTVLNAANEAAVLAFLESGLRFDQIPELIEHVLAEVNLAPLNELEDVFVADRRARESAAIWLARNNVGAKLHVLRASA